MLNLMEELLLLALDDEKGKIISSSSFIILGVLSFISDIL